MFPFPKFRFGVSPVFLLFALFNLQADAQNCIMICNDTVNVDIQLEGHRKILPDILLENPAQCPGPFQVDVFVGNRSIGDTVRCDLVGEILRTEISFLGTPSNSCESYIRIEDKSPPVLDCRDTIVPCGLDPDSVLLISIDDNCDPAPSFFYTDNIVDSFCTANIYNAVITRTWRARDNYNNISPPCIQNIFFRKVNLSDVIFPNDTILIDTFSTSITPSNIDSVTGITPPLIDGYPIGFYCKFNVLSEDQIFPICEGSFKIFRKWTVVDCCSGDKLEDYQIIELLDNTPPEIDCPDSLSFATSPDDCVANFILPAAVVSDDNTTNPSVEVIYPGGRLNSNGGIITGLPLGVHDILYIAKDDCNNADTCITVIEVFDNIVPTPVCVEKLVININSRGIGCVPASSFDAGSTDNCSIDSIAVKRPGEPDSLFRDQLCLFCDDIPGPIMVITRFIDSTGNYNDCMTEVRPQDKISPSIICAPDTSLQCTVDFRDTSITGVPTAIDNCDSLIYTFIDDTTGLNFCHTGIILRNWTVTDAAGLTDVCTQQITLIDTTPTVFTNIPPDSTVYCPVDIDNLDAGEPIPVFDCEKWGLNIKDSLSVEPCTTQIERTFTFREWCTGDDTMFFQTITVIDTSGPIWLDTIGSLDAFFECDDDVRIIGPSARDLCASTVNVRQASNIVTPGSCPNDYTRIIGFLAEDNCGNITTDTFFVTITVLDTIAPIISGAPRDTIANCDANLPEPNVIISDNCGLPISEFFIENNIPTSCPETEKRQQIWIAEDQCGNRDSVSRILTRIDTVPPTALTPADSIYGCPEDIPPADPEVILGETDNCSLPVTVALFQDDTIDNPCLDTLIRIYQLTDSCGNFSFINHRIILKDTIPPRVQSCPGMIRDTLDFPFSQECVGPVSIMPASYLDNCPGTTVTVSNDSPFADNNMSNDASGTYPLGIHRFKFYGTDECLNVNDLCEVELTVVEQDRPRITCASEPIPIYLDATGNATIRDFQIIPEAFDFCSTVETIIQPNTFTCADYMGAPTRIELVIASVVDTFGNVSDCLPRAIILNDTFNICPTAPPAPPGFTGGFIYANKNQPVENVEVKMTGGHTGNFMTNRFGGYQFEHLEAGKKIQIQPSKNDGPLKGVSTYDLMLISKIILGNADHFTPYQHIAADVNNSGSVTVSDIVELRKMILGLTHNFNNNTSWRFVDADYEFKNPSEPLNEDFPETIERVHTFSDFELNFTGIKIGDLNGDSMTDSLQHVSDRSNRRPSYFSIENQEFKPERSIRIKVKSEEDLKGFQFAFSFDTRVLEFTTLIAGDGKLSQKHFNLNHSIDGALPVSYNGNISKGETVFELEFSTKGFGNLENSLFFNDKILVAESYPNSSTLTKPELQFVTPEGSSQHSFSFELFQNQPNPFSNHTEIKCRLKEETNVKLEIFDMTGKRIFEERRRMNPGLRTFRVENRYFGESGVYTYKMTTPTGVRTRRMIFIKSNS